MESAAAFAALRSQERGLAARTYISARSPPRRRSAAHQTAGLADRASERIRGAILLDASVYGMARAEVERTIDRAIAYGMQAPR